MKLLLVTILSCLTLFKGQAQTNRIDTLLSQLDNQKLIGVCNYVWVLKNGSKEADSLIQIGKTKNIDLTSLYLKLYTLLTDPTKGIISHYILTNILQSNNFTSGSICFYDDDNTLEYNGLRFYENKYKRMFTEKSELEHNKTIWGVIFKQMKITQ